MSLINILLALLLITLATFYFFLSPTLEFSSWNKLKYLKLSLKLGKLKEIRLNILEFSVVLKSCKDRWIYFSFEADKVEVEINSEASQLAERSSTNEELREDNSLERNENSEQQSKQKSKTLPSWITPLLLFTLNLLKLLPLKLFSLKVHNIDYFNANKSSQLSLRGLQYSAIDLSFSIKELLETSHHPPITLETKDFSNSNLNLKLNELYLKLNILANGLDLNFNIDKLTKVLLETKSESDSGNKSKKSDLIDINNILSSIYNNGEISKNLQSYLIIFNLRLKFNISQIEIIKPIQNSTQPEITKLDQLSISVNTALIPHQLKLNPKSFELSVGLNKLDINDEILVNGAGFEVSDMEFNSEFNWKLNFNIGEIIAIAEIKSPFNEAAKNSKTKANSKSATLELPILPFNHSINLNLSASIDKTQLILTPTKLKLSQITDASYYLELGLNQLNLTSNLLNYHSTNKFEITSSLELSQLCISNEQSSFSLNTLEIMNYNELQFDGIKYFICTETSFDLQYIRLMEGELGFIYELLPYLNKLYKFKESVVNGQDEGFSSSKTHNSAELVDAIGDKTGSNQVNSKIPVDFKTHKLQLNLHRLSATLQSHNWNLESFKEQIISYSDSSELPKDHLLPCPKPLSLEINSINLKLEGLPNNLHSITKFDGILFNVKDSNLVKLSYFSLAANLSEDSSDEGYVLGLKGNLQKFEVNYELSKVYYLLKLVHKVKDIKELVGGWLLNKGNSDDNEIINISSSEDALKSNKKNLSTKLEFSLFNLITKMELKEHQIIWIYLNHIHLGLCSSTLQSQGSDSTLPSIELGLESIRIELDPKVLPTVPNSIKFLSPPESETPPSLQLFQLDSIKLKLPVEKLLINQALQKIVYIELTSLKLTIPDKVLIYEFIDELNLQVKTIKLLMKPELGTVLPPPLPSPMELKPTLPFVLDLKIGEWVILIENNEFEKKLNKSVSVGWDEQIERMFLDSQLDFKIQTTSNDSGGTTGGDSRASNTGLQRPQFKRGPPTSSSFISQKSSNTAANKSSNDRRLDPQAALAKIKEVKSTRWIRKIQEFDANYPILRATGTKFHIQLSPTNLKATTKAGAVCLIDEQTPDDTKFDLFLSFHINLTQEQIIFRLRDYPIPLLHVPKLHPSQVFGEDVKLSYNQVGEIIIAEPWGGLETAKWRTVSIDPDNNIPTVSVCKTLTPIKFYQHQRISILSRLPTTLTFGVAYRSALADMTRRLDTVTSPSFPNVCPLGWWDKARLQMHSKLKIEFNNDGEFRALMLGTDHPYIKSTNYSQIETKYGFQHTWKGGTCIKFKGNGVQNFSITSDCYRLVIPKLVLGDNSKILGVVNPMGQFKQNWLKVVIKLKNFVTLESNWSYFKRHEFDPQLNIPIEVAHYEVIPKVPLENQLDYDPFRGFRSDRISILINVKSQPNSETLVKKDIANSFHFTPQTWTCVRRFLQLFDSDRSLPIQLGDLFPKKLPPSSTPFSTRLFQIQFELNLHPTFVSYNLTVGPQNSQRDYVNLMDGVGIKGGSNALHLSIVMGKRNKILLDRENTDTPVTPLTPGNSRQSNALEWYLKRMCFDVDQPDIRTVGVKYILPTKVDNHRSTNDPSSEATADNKSSTSARDKPFKPDEDGWLDPDDHKTPWNLTSESFNISVKVQPFLSAPKLTYYSGEEYNGLNTSELPYDPLKIELNMYNKRLKYINKKLSQLEDFLNNTERCISDEIIQLAEQQINRMENHKQKLEGIIGVKKNNVDDYSTWEGISYSRHLNVFQPIVLIDQTNQKHLHHFLFLMERDTALSDFWKRRYRSGLAQLEKRYHQTMKQMANLGRKGKKGKKEKFNSKGGSVYEKNSLESEKIFEEIINSFRFDSEPMDSAHTSTTPDDLSTNQQQDQVQKSQIITEPVWLINLYALQMVFLPNHDFVSDPLFQADTISSDSSVDDSLKSLVLSIYQTQLSIGKLFDNNNNQSFLGPVLIQDRYNLNLKYAQFFVTNDYHHHNHCSIYHALEIPYSKPCDETSLDRDYSNWVPIELIIPRCKGDEEDYLSTQEVIDNFKLEQRMNNMQYESIVLPFQSHLTYTRPNPLYVPNTPEECGGTDLSTDLSVQDHINLEIPQFHLRTNGSQYFALLTNIHALLTYHEPRKRRFREQLDERSLLVSAIGWQQEFRRLCNLWDNYQDQILLYHQVLNNSHQVDSCSETLLNELQTLELDYLTCLDQLVQVISVLTEESKRQFNPSKTNSNGVQGGSPQGGEDLGSNLSKLIEIEIKEVDWNLLDTFDNNTSKPFCELKSKSVKLILNLDPDGGQRLRFLVEQVVGFNLIEDTRYIQLLTPHQSQQQNNSHRFTTGDMIHVYLKTLPKVGGMEVIDHLEINIFPCLIQITHAITMKVIDFLGLKHGISNNINKSSGLSDKKAIKDTSSINSDKLPLTTKSSDNFVIDLMKKRAQLNITFIYIKVPATQLCMSYQGKKQTNFADLHQVTFKTPDLVYHNQTLSWLEFLELVKKEVIHAAFVQAGGLVKDLIMNKPPPSIDLAARSRVHSSSPLSRSGTQVSESSNISAFNSPRSQVFYINNNENQQQLHPGDDKSISTNETHGLEAEGWQDTRSRLSLPHRLFGIPKLRVTSDHGDLASIASSKSTRLSILSNPALDRDDNTSIGSVLTSGQSTGINTPNQSNFASPSPASSTLPMRKGTSLDISKAATKYAPSHSIHSFAMSQTNSPIPIHFEFLRASRHLGPDLARVIDPDIQLEVIVNDEFMQKARLLFGKNYKPYFATGTNSR